jgi:hypothetical protein
VRTTTRMSRCRCSVVGGGCSRRGSPGAGAAAIHAMGEMPTRGGLPRRTPVPPGTRTWRSPASR